MLLKTINKHVRETMKLNFCNKSFKHCSVKYQNNLLDKIAKILNDNLNMLNSLLRLTII